MTDDTSTRQTPPLIVGIDVGGTNTDAIVLRSDTKDLLVCAKVPTSADVATGICGAVRALFAPQSPRHAFGAQHRLKLEKVRVVFLGTTAFVIALLEGRGLSRAVVVRLTGPSSRCLPPLTDFPVSLRDVVFPSCGVGDSCIGSDGSENKDGEVGKERLDYWFASGGLYYDGKREECRVNEDELVQIAKEIRETTMGGNGAAVEAVVVSCTFSPCDNGRQERHAASILREHLPPSIRVSVSCDSGRLGLLPRENAALLNACLHPMARKTMASARKALRDAGVPDTARLYLTTNDGAVVEFGEVGRSPLRCVSSGPVNSLRGAAFLSSLSEEEVPTASVNQIGMDRIVLDIGGTSTDAGCLIGGRYPRRSNAESTVGGVRCNQRTTDVISIALGGGSVIRKNGTSVSVGPDSVGADITRKALCFGGTVCTATCVAVLMGSDMSSAQVEDGVNKDSSPQEEAMNRSMREQPTRDFPAPPFVGAAWDAMQTRFLDLVDKTRTDARPIEVLVVGGGAGLVDADRLSRALGNCSVVRPKFAHVANACGSALAQGAGEAEIIADLSSGKNKREEVLEEMKNRARKAALGGEGNHGATEIIECDEVPLAYLPGKVTRIFVRAVAPLHLSDQESAPGCEDDQDLSQSFCADAERPPALRQPDPPPLTPTDPNLKDGVWTVSEYDAHCISIGSGILGCGGGGSTHHDLLQLLRCLQGGKQVRIVSALSIPENALVAPCGMMGAPTVSIETIGSAEQLHAAVCRNFELASPAVNPDAAFVTVMEIGGGNGLIPLVVAGLLDRPVVDADLMGRAFPELQMITPTIYGLPRTPMTASDAFGRCVTLTAAPSLPVCGMEAPSADLKWEERVLRPVSVEFGCLAGLATPPLTGAQLRRVGVIGSLSRARRIGDCVLRSSHPREAVETLLRMEGGRQIFEGKVSDVHRETTQGFAKGSLTVLGLDDASAVTIDFQNEFLVARLRLRSSSCDDGDSPSPPSAPSVIGCVPDLICLIDADTARPIATEDVHFGFRVCILLLPSSPLLRTPEALRVVGPTAFGLEDCASYESGLYSNARDEETTSIADT